VQRDLNAGVSIRPHPRQSTRPGRGRGGMRPSWRTGHVQGTVRISLGSRSGSKNPHGPARTSEPGCEHLPNVRIPTTGLGIAGSPDRRGRQEDADCPLDCPVIHDASMPPYPRS
jgi:hypothetical protein